MDTPTESSRPVRLCFVCLGNICRSPTAEAVMRHLVEEAGLNEAIEIDSAGTAAYHEGEQSDARSRRTAETRGMRLTSIARQFDVDDFNHFDYVLAMDEQNYNDLRSLLDDRGLAEDTLYLFRDFDPQSPKGSDVPDPYHGGADGFAEVFAICEAACRGLLAHLVEAHSLRPA